VFIIVIGSVCDVIGASDVIFDAGPDGLPENVLLVVVEVARRNIVDLNCHRKQLVWDVAHKGPHLVCAIHAVASFVGAFSVTDAELVRRAVRTLAHRGIHGARGSGSSAPAVLCRAE